jgi:hypothetical protein
VVTALVASALGLVVLAGRAAGAPVAPIPPGPLDPTVPTFIGRAATDRPIDAFRVPQHPHMARTGFNSMHNDAYATDAYRGGGPLGRDLEVTSATYGVVECATVTFDSRGRLVGLCGGLQGFQLMLIDPDTLEATATMQTSQRDVTSGNNPLSDLCGGAYFYLDDRDRAIVETVDGTVMVVQVTADGFALRRTYDATAAIPDGDCLIALMPDWDGRIWFVTKGGGVGTIDRATGRVRSLRLPGERIVNSFATDETGGVYIVSDHALYRFDATRAGAPRVTWRQRYDRGSEQKPGQLSQGSGTTPTLIGKDLVAITDNADPRMHVISYDRRRGVTGPRKVCSAAVFTKGASATENSLVAAGRSVVAENNYGYENPSTTTLGRSTTPGVAKVGVGRRNCGVQWTSKVIAPTSVPKGVAGVRAGLRLRQARRPAGRPVVLHRDRRAHRPHRLAAPHRHRHAVEQPLRRDLSRTRPHGVRRDAGRPGEDRGRMSAVPSASVGACPSSNGSTGSSGVIHASGSRSRCSTSTSTTAAATSQP